MIMLGQKFLDMLNFQKIRTRDFYLFQKNQTVWLFFVLLSLLSVKSFASPVPALGSSALANQSKSYIFYLKGFSLNPTGSSWRILQAEENNESSTVLDGEISNKTKARSKELSLAFAREKSPGLFTVKTETLSAATDVEHYSKKWIRDYAFFGFDVMGAKPFNQNTDRGYVIDLFHRKQNKQVRQVIFLKDKTSIILTCTDDQKSFKETLGVCNSVIKTFQWL